MHQHNLKKVMRPDRTINLDYDQTNFSVIPASGTVALSIQCAELVGHESRLAERSLQHLASLRDLSIAHCKLAALPRHSLAGLQRLANLSVHTHPEGGEAGGLGLGELSLEVEAGALAELRGVDLLLGPPIIQRQSLVNLN